MPSQPTNAGIVVDASSGERHIPESMRADGSTRKAIKIRPGYRPPEDVEVYKNRTAESFRTRSRAAGVPGSAGVKDDENAKGSDGVSTGGSSSNKNSKRREARKRAKASGSSAAAADGDDDEADAGSAGGLKQAAGDAPSPAQAAADKAEAEADAEVEQEKKVRNLRKKLRQAKELKDKKDGGQSLLPEQIAKVIKINEIIRELDALGFGPDGEPKAGNASGDKAAAKD